MASNRHRDRVVPSSGNVFTDLDVPGAIEKQTKTRLAAAINHIIEEAHLSQAATAGLLGIGQPKVSALVNYRLEGFSVERLMTFLNSLGRDVEIVIRRSHPRRTPRIHVTAA